MLCGPLSLTLREVASQGDACQDRPLDPRNVNLDAGVVRPEIIGVPTLSARAVAVRLLAHLIVPLRLSPAQLPVDGGNGVDVVTGVFLCLAAADSAVVIKGIRATSQEVQCVFQVLCSTVRVADLHQRGTDCKILSVAPKGTVKFGSPSHVYCCRLTTLSA